MICLKRIAIKKIYFVVFACFLYIFITANVCFAGNQLFEIRVPMSIGATVTAVRPDGQSADIGNVTALPTTTRWPSYTASAWGTPGEVCASAVNAIHMLVSVEGGRGRTLSIIPQETIAPAAGPGASIVISAKAGTGIFGAWAPPVGSVVSVLHDKDNTRETLSLTNLPQQADTLIIRAIESDMPYMVEIENRPGGRITEWNTKECTVIGRVIRPARGVGRFAGTKFQATGELRANHPGVIDFSTSPINAIGGFQIIPWDHALTSKEMQNVWDLTQWMIAAPIDGQRKMGGTFPLFRNALVPGTSENEQLWDMWATYGRKSPLLVRLNGGPWQQIPVAEGKNNNAFTQVTHMRIYYPITYEPLKQN